MGNFCCIVCELDDFVDDDDRAFQRQHNQRKKQLKEQQDVLSYGLILTLPGSPDRERARYRSPNIDQLGEYKIKPKIASEMAKR